MTITCLKAGTLATIQDLGRIGYQNLGIIVSGAMDSYAMKMANIIVGNPQAEACIEITMRGSSFQFNEDMLIAITGGDLQPVLNNKELPQWRPVFVKANSVIKFKGNRVGLRSYMAVSGGFAIPEKLSSKSTYLRAAFGGYNGRSLEKDDIIPTNKLTVEGEKIIALLLKKQQDYETTSWHIRPKFYEQNEAVNRIRFIEGNEYAWFTEASHTQFEHTSYKVGNASDRMGYRLIGSNLEKSKPREMISEGLVNGTVQIANDGSPIVLLADRQTTGGYPRIAQIISADLYKFGQLKPEDSIQFEKVSLEVAFAALYELEQTINKIKLMIRLKSK